MSDLIKFPNKYSGGCSHCHLTVLIKEGYILKSKRTFINYLLHGICLSDFVKENRAKLFPPNKAGDQIDLIYDAKPSEVNKKPPET